MAELMKRWIPYVLFFVVFVAAHGLDLGTSITADEPPYLQQSGGFYNAVSNGNFENTFRLPHPGVPALWLGSAAYRILIPEFNQTLVNRLPGLQYALFFEQHGVRPLQVLSLARAFSVVFNAGLLTLAFWLFARVLRREVVWLGMLLVTLDPFFFSFVRILGVDGILSSALFVCVAAYGVYWHTQQRRYLAVLGVALAVAGLSKVTAAAFLPFFVIAEAIWVVANRQTMASWRHKAFDWAVMLLAVALTSMALWPVLWGAPLETVAQLATYSLSTSAGEITLNSPQFFAGEQSFTGEILSPWFYPTTLLWRSSMLQWAGMLAAGCMLWRERRRTPFSMLAALGFGVLFVVLVTISSKKSDRYILPIYLLIDVIAAWGLVGLVRWLGISTRLRWAGVALLVVAGLWPIVQSHPHYYSIYNPVMRQIRDPQEVLSIGWGEGMNEAAAFLNAQPGIYDATIFAWYPEVLKLHLHAHPAQPRQIQYAQEVGDLYYEEVLAADWVVIYINMEQREIAKPITDHYATQIPAHVVTINGFETVKIYRNP